MRKILILLVFVVGCKKAEQSSPFKVVTYSYGDVWESVGIQYEKKYWLLNSIMPDTLVFHNDNTITELFSGSAYLLHTTSHAVDTFVNLPQSLPGTFTELKYIIYHKLDVPIPGNGFLSAEISTTNVRLSKYGNNTWSLNSKLIQGN